MKTPASDRFANHVEYQRASNRFPTRDEDDRLMMLEALAVIARAAEMYVAMKLAEAAEAEKEGGGIRASLS